MSGDPHARVIEIEQRIEDLSDYAERCRKEMRLSRAAILVGLLLLVAALAGLAGFHGEIAGISGFAAMIGGFVWLGANKSSGEEARAALQRARAELAAAIDALGLQRLN
jgi:hypothetical protein